MSILANAKTKATSGSVKAAFTNEDGAIDLASIMVGIIVIGLIGGVIAATVFAVIPWAQDNAAKQQLDSVASAQSAYIGLSTDANNGVVTTTDSKGSFGTGAQLKTANLFDAANANVTVVAGGSGSTAHYGAAVTSPSGKVFFIGDRKTNPTTVSDGGSEAQAAAAGLAGKTTGVVKPAA